MGTPRDVPRIGLSGVLVVRVSRLSLRYCWESSGRISREEETCRHLFSRQVTPLEFPKAGPLGMRVCLATRIGDT